MVKVVGDAPAKAKGAKPVPKDPAKPSDLTPYLDAMADGGLEDFLATLEERATPELVDILGEADELVRVTAATAGAAAEGAKRVLRERSGNAPADEQVTHYGGRFRAELSKVPETTTITDKHAAFEMLSADPDVDVVELVTIPVSVLNDYLTPAQRKKVLSRERTGTRTVKVKRLKKEGK